MRQILEQRSGLSPEKICQGRIVGILLPQIDLAGCHPVTEHFRHIPGGHGHRLHLPGRRHIVRPVLEMMAVPPLVVHPGKGVALVLPLPLVGAPGADIIPGAGNEFRGSILGQVMPQPLPENPRPPAVPHDSMPMSGNGTEMPPKRMPAHGKNLLLQMILLV